MITYFQIYQVWVYPNCSLWLILKISTILNKTQYKFIMTWRDQNLLLVYNKLSPINRVVRPPAKPLCCRGHQTARTNLNSVPQLRQLMHWNGVRILLRPRIRTCWRLVGKNCFNCFFISDFQRSFFILPRRVCCTWHPKPSNRQRADPYPTECSRNRLYL